MKKKLLLNLTKMDPHRMLLINTTSPLAKSPVPSEVSPTPSLDSTGSDPLKYLEEDNLDEESTNLVFGKNTRCLICNYVFHSEADFVHHGRVHFGNSFQKDLQVQQQQFKTQPPPYPDVYQISGANSLPAPPPPMYNWTPYTCSFCHLGFNSYDIMMCHVKLYHYHQQFQTYGDRSSTSMFQPHNLLQPFYNRSSVFNHGVGQRGVCPKPRNGKKCSCIDCQKLNATHVTPTVTSSDRPAKRKRVEKEDLDEATLAKMREMEWERCKGYWCTKCNVRFESQGLLVDHMSSKEHSATK